jgi:restriction system protein
MNITTMTNLVTNHQQYLFIGAACFVTFMLFIGRKKKSKRHKYKIQVGGKALDKIRTFQHPSQQIGYLRKIDAYAFEELLLSALKEAGAKITRNKRYTGDGGIDGKCKYLGQQYFVQAKRYTGYINSADVQEFSSICQRNRVRGLFIHTGKTGAKSHKVKSNNVNIIDDEKLISLVIHKQLPTKCHI